MSDDIKRVPRPESLELQDKYNEEVRHFYEALGFIPAGSLLHKETEVTQKEDEQ